RNGPTDAEDAFSHVGGPGLPRGRSEDHPREGPSPPSSSGALPRDILASPMSREHLVRREKPSCHVTSALLPPRRRAPPTWEGSLSRVSRSFLPLGRALSPSSGIAFSP